MILKLLLPASLLTGCKDNAEPQATDTAAETVYPTMMVTADQRDTILGRLDREPYATIFDELQARAAQDRVEPEEGGWDHGAWGHNAEIAQHNAMLAWLLDDRDAAERALAELDALDDDFESSTTWDVNIRMPHVLMGFTNALDLLRGTDFISPAQVDDATLKLTTINREFFERYIETDVYRLTALYPSQNNHSIRTAAAIGYVALAFPDDPDADQWASWAFSELDYLWGPDGQYVQPDGGVSEGPFYFGFAWGVSTALFFAVDNAMPAGQVLTRDCRNRQTLPPWDGQTCVEGEAFTFQNPLHDPLYHATVAWSLALRLPDGSRPPLADAYLNPFNGAALLTGVPGVSDPGMYRWEWESNRTDPLHMTHGADLIGHHLAYFDDRVAAAEPPWTTRFMPDAGSAIFRSSWAPDARWGLLLAEHGSARMTLHDHVDGLSFTVAAYGDYLLIDPGYYKPNALDNAHTAQAEAHNVILIDGQGAPEKGLLTDFGDADAWLAHTLDAARIDYAEAHQEYAQTRIERAMMLVRDRYFVVADRLDSDSSEARLHSWRLHTGAGEDLGGTFTPWRCTEGTGCGVEVAQESGGAAVHLASTAAGLQVTTPALADGEPPHIHRYDRSRSTGHHGVIDGEVVSVAPGFLAVVAPYKVGESGADGPLSVQGLDLGEGAAGWLIETAQGIDLALLREPGAPERFSLPDGRTIDTDGRFVLMSISDDAFTLVARGTRVLLDSTPRLEGAAADAVTVAEP
jgi:hypothetical protein